MRSKVTKIYNSSKKRAAGCFTNAWLINRLGGRVKAPGTTVYVIDGTKKEKKEEEKKEEERS